MPTSFDPTADLDAAKEALLAVLKLVHGPCVAHAGAPNEDRDTIAFRRWQIGSAVPLLRLVPHKHGYAVIAGREADAMVGIGETPADAMWRAVEALDTVIPMESAAIKSWPRLEVVLASWLWAFLSIGIS